MQIPFCMSVILFRRWKKQPLGIKTTVSGCLAERNVFCVEEKRTLWSVSFPGEIIFSAAVASGLTWVFCSSASCREHMADWKCPLVIWSPAAVSNHSCGVVFSFLTTLSNTLLLQGPCRCSCAIHGTFFFFRKHRMDSLASVPTLSGPISESWHQLCPRVMAMVHSSHQIVTYKWGPVSDSFWGVYNYWWSQVSFTTCPSLLFFSHQ